GIIFSGFYFHMSECIVLAISDFLLHSALAFLVYLVSIYIVESIALYKFEYRDEILRKKNMTYSLICFTHSICLAFIVKTILEVSQDSLIVLLLLWPFTMVVMGFAIKSYRFISKLSFDKHLLLKDLGMSLSYTGYFWGWTFIICSAIPQNIIEIRWYTIQIILKILLSLIIFPVIQKSLIWMFRMKDDFDKSSHDQGKGGQLSKIGYGIYEGSLFFTSCYLTSVITGNIHFGSYYPVTP
ncbi:MAG: hypothetical protein OXB84_01790, partial [Halobacteriovoraceae bacterium]|nr:hypothetical protein [Halobacteriovoraceae bacterium]